MDHDLPLAAETGPTAETRQREHASRAGATLLFCLLAAGCNRSAQDSTSELNLPVPVQTFAPVAVDPQPLADPYAYPAYEGYDLDCADVGRPVRVDGDDPHRLDRDGDGWGCESY